MGIQPKHHATPTNDGKYLFYNAPYTLFGSKKVTFCGFLTQIKSQMVILPRYLVILQEFPSNATPHDCNTSNLVAIRGSHCNLSVKWLQYVSIMQRIKCVAICVVCRCNRSVLLQLF
jgi:hypothetical protein